MAAVQWRQRSTPHLTLRRHGPHGINEKPCGFIRFTGQRPAFAIHRPPADVVAGPFTKNFGTRYVITALLPTP